MDLKPLIVKSYLESLTEENELNYIFPIYLRVNGFNILSKPSENKGLPEYGKDIVAINREGNRRYYFELKGGSDRNITNSTFVKNDGIKESLIEAKYAKFSTEYENFDSLPLTIVLVHNGELRGSARELFTGFIKTEFSKSSGIKFERWGIEKLTAFFAKDLFGPYLLINEEMTKLFNRVLINLNYVNDVSRDFIILLSKLFSQNIWEGYKGSLQRKWIQLFETIKLISFIIYTESKEYNNLDIAKRYLTELVLKFWHWVLENNLEKDKKVINYFLQILEFYFSVLSKYFTRTLPIATYKYGLSSEISGKYEQIGYPKRTYEYLGYFSFYIKGLKWLNPNFKDNELKTHLTKVINANSVSFKPLIDINSIVIVNVLNLYLSWRDQESAINFLKAVISYIITRKEKSGILPDANNNFKSVIKYELTGQKPTYYSDSTSPLLAVLIEYIVILNQKDLFVEVREFVLKHKIDLGLFVPHHGINSITLGLIESENKDLELQLFSNPYFDDGYQSNISFFNNLNEEVNYEEFKKKLRDRKKEFEYTYRTDIAGFTILKDLAHFYFNTPYFPDKWRSLIDVDKKNEIDHS